MPQIWVVPGGLFVVLVAIWLAGLLKQLDRHTRFLFLLAGAVYVGSAIIVETAGEEWFLLDGNEFLLNGIFRLVEEFGEMAGVLIFIGSLLDLLKSSLVREGIIEISFSHQSSGDEKEN